MITSPNYDRLPSIRAQRGRDRFWQGWKAILDRLRGELEAGARTVAVECYPGVRVQEIAHVLVEGLRPKLGLLCADFYRRSEDIVRMTEHDLTEDPVFGRMNGFTIEDFGDEQLLQAGRSRLSSFHEGSALVVGTGTGLLVPDPDVLVYADLPRWEIQQRYRSGDLGNLGVANRADGAAPKYKRGFFLDWRVADRIKKPLLQRMDFLLDTTDGASPKLVTGDALREELRRVAGRPFRVVPFFDPGPWGGQWMRERLGLGGDAPNYAWGFDCVPEENSIRLDFGTGCLEIPALDLVFSHPREVLGDAVYARFGTEFPIRFDLLDTMAGGSLSLQVHPLTEYIQDRFGMAYTQDESYYLLDAAPDATVYLGVRRGVDRSRMARELRRAATGQCLFPVTDFVNCWPAQKHDHFLIPAGTIHCSGRNSMVLEISATPYIFTFKLWDWGRLGLDGKPRPIHLEHGLANIQWDRDADWVARHLVNRMERIDSGDGWVEERTGLHETQFIETRRHWFSGTALHETRGGVQVLNLVEGDSAIVASPDHAFDEFEVHYAETFIVPAAAGRYRIRPGPGVSGCATMRASVRA